MEEKIQKFKQLINESNNIVFFCGAGVSTNRRNKMYYYTYMLRCSDNSIYTGMTGNLEKRINEHLSKNGAKYTKSHNVTKVEAAWRSKEKSLACKLEYHIKKLSKGQKEELINGVKLSVYLKGKIDCRRYKKIDL